MKLIIIFSLFTLPLNCWADARNIERCTWGYLHTATVQSLSEVDPLAPTKLTARDLCRLIFDSDENHESNSWIQSSISFLKNTKHGIKPFEFVSRNGQCQLGSIVAQKRFIDSKDNLTVSLTAKNVCKKIPARLISES